MSRSPPAFNQNDLAKALGVSASRITGLKRQGMPTGDVESARRWREANVRPQARPGSQWNHGEVPSGFEDEDAEERELDIGDAFACIAIAAHERPERHVYSLMHILPLLTDEQYERVRRSGYITQRVWDAIDEVWRQVYER